MIGQTRPGLQAYHIPHALFHQLRHLTRQQPALPGHIAQGHVLRRQLRHFVNGNRRGKMLRLRQGLPHGAHKEIRYLDKHLGAHLVQPAAVQNIVPRNAVKGHI